MRIGNIMHARADDVWVGGLLEGASKLEQMFALADGPAIAVRRKTL